MRINMLSIIIESVNLYIDKERIKREISAKGFLTSKALSKKISTFGNLYEGTWEVYYCRPGIPPKLISLHRTTYNPLRDEVEPTLINKLVESILELKSSDQWEGILNGADI